MKVLVACEFSGIVRDAFIARGHDAWSCDLLPTESPGPHIQGDVLGVLGDGWDLMIAHPPCTYLSLVGNRHLKAPGRMENIADALKFFARICEAPIQRKCVENPLGHASRLYRRHDQIIHPWMFGDPFMKRTCLWLYGLPKLYWTSTQTLFDEATAIDPPKPIYYLKTSGKAIHWTEAVKGAHKRSRFWPGIARAMAEQWG